MANQERLFAIGAGAVAAIALGRETSAAGGGLQSLGDPQVTLTTA